MTASGAIRLMLALVAGVAATAVAGSIVQTQVNLAAIARMGVAVPAQIRWATTAEDVLRFGPLMALIALAAFLPAFAVAGGVARLLRRGRLAVYALAGIAGLWTAFAVMGFVTPMPTLVAAARSAPGLAALCATGGLGGLVFALLTRGRRGPLRA